MKAGDLSQALCKAFCSELTVREVPAGLAISGMFEAADGDRLGCLIENTSAGWKISDDGAFLADLEAFGMDVTKGGRADFLARALAPAGAHVDQETLQIVADVSDLTPGKVLSFLTALSRAQDITFWSKERVRSTFKEDATTALRSALHGEAVLDETGVVDANLLEFPADLVIRPKSADGLQATTAVYLVQAIDALQEALLLVLELRSKRRLDVRVTAIIEDGSIAPGSAKAMRAVNRLDAVSYFRNDEQEAAHKIARTAVPALALS